MGRNATYGESPGNVSGGDGTSDSDLSASDDNGCYNQCQQIPLGIEVLVDCLQSLQKITPASLKGVFVGLELGNLTFKLVQ